MSFLFLFRIRFAKIKLMKLLITGLGWKLEYNFEKAIRETIDWYKNNTDWWKKIKSGEYLEYYKKQYNK